MIASIFHSQKNLGEMDSMRAAIMAIMCLAICSQVNAQAKRDPFSIKFSELTQEERAELFKDTGSFFRNRLLAEADRRRIDPEVKTYLQISLAAWLRALSEDTDASSAIIESAKNGELSPELAVAVLKDRRNLLDGRYFAEATSKGVSFGEFIVEGKVLQIIDEHNLIATVRPIGGEDSSTIWVEGVNTSGLFDDASLSLTFFATRLWQMNGTKSYTSTVGAKKTVPLLKLYPLEKKKVTEHIDLFEFGKLYKSLTTLLDASKKENEKAIVKAERAAKTRTWTDVSGEFSVQAEYRGIAGDYLLLKKKDGKTTRIPLARLSADDQQWIKERQMTSKK